MGHSPDGDFSMQETFVAGRNARSAMFICFLSCSPALWSLVLVAAQVFHKFQIIPTVLLHTHHYALSTAVLLHVTSHSDFISYVSNHKFLREIFPGCQDTFNITGGQTRG